MSHIYLTIDQIEALYHLAKQAETRGGRGVQISGDDYERSLVTLVTACERNGVHDTDHAEIEADGAAYGWTR